MPEPDDDEEPRHLRCHTCWNLGPYCSCAVPPSPEYFGERPIDKTGRKFTAMSASALDKLNATINERMRERLNESVRRADEAIGRAYNFPWVDRPELRPDWEDIPDLPFGCECEECEECADWEEDDDD